MIRLCVKVHLLFVKAKDNGIKISTSGIPKCLMMLQNTYSAFYVLMEYYHVTPIRRRAPPERSFT